MLVEEFMLDHDCQRPVIQLGSGLRVLLDTGALFPVWSGPEWLFRAMNGLRLSNNVVSFSGFGGTASGYLGSITLTFGKIVYKDMHIIVSPVKNMNEHVILSAANFDGMSYTIDTISHRLTLNIPDNNNQRSLIISERNKKLYACQHKVEQATSF